MTKKKPVTKSKLPKAYKRKPEELKALKWDGTFDGVYDIASIFTDLSFNVVRFRNLVWEIIIADSHGKNKIVMKKGDYIIERGSSRKTYDVMYEDDFSAIYEEYHD